jgi:thiamine-phosphate pyrophosphorylase
MLIGVSTHSLAEAKAAEAGGADFLTIGPIFETPSKAKLGFPVGLEIIKYLKNEITIPFYALGGIESGKIRRVMGAGANGVAMISAILGAEDIKKASSKLIKAITFIDKILCESCTPR